MVRISAIVGAVLMLGVGHGQAQYPGYPAPPQFAPSYPPLPPGFPPAAAPGYAPFPGQGAPGYGPMPPPGYGQPPAFPVQMPGPYPPPGPPGYGQPPAFPVQMPGPYPPPAPPGLPPGSPPMMPNGGGPGFFTGSIPGAPGQPPVFPGQPTFDPCAETIPPLPPPVTQAPSEPGLPLGGVISYIEPPYENPFPHFWCGSEYLYWWIQDAPVRIPLVTSNDDPLTQTGALGEPNTRIIYGAGSANSPRFSGASGGRAFLGFWIDDQETLGFEGSGFILEQLHSIFTADSQGGLAPLIAVPFFATEPFNFNPAGETSLNAGGAPNHVEVSANARLWGADGSVLLNFVNFYFCRLLLLGGFRYLDLAEDLVLTDTFYDIPGNGTVVVRDRFQTFNHFYGGQMGLRLEGVIRCWTLSATAKISLGSNRQTMNIDGQSTVNNDAFGLPSGTTAGGVFAEPSNIGIYSRNVYAYSPEGQVQIGYLLNKYMRPFVSYNFLYLSNVLRPGNQLDRDINPTQNVLFGGGVVSGPLAPTPTFRSSDFWAHGLSLGLEFRY